MLVAKNEFNYEPERKEQPKQKKIIKKKKVTVINKSMYLGIIAMFVISSFFILNRYVNITQARYEITENQNQLRELELEKIDLQASLEGQKSTTRISESAQKNLGMVYPEEEQIVYVSVDNGVGDTQDDMNLAQRIKEIFSIFSSIF